MRINHLMIFLICVNLRNQREKSLFKRVSDSLFIGGFLMLLAFAVALAMGHLVMLYIKTS